MARKAMSATGSAWRNWSLNSMQLTIHQIFGWSSLGELVDVTEPKIAVGITRDPPDGSGLDDRAELRRSATSVACCNPFPKTARSDS